MCSPKHPYSLGSDWLVVTPLQTLGDTGSNKAADRRQWSLPCPQLCKQSETRRSKDRSCSHTWDPWDALPKPGISCVAQTLIPWCELHVDGQGDWELEQWLLKKRLEELGLFSLGRDGFAGSYWHLQILDRKEIWRQTLLRCSQLEDGRQKLQVEINQFWLTLCILFHGEDGKVPQRDYENSVSGDTKTLPDNVTSNPVS